MIQRGLRGRPTLKRVCLLLDARRGAMENDSEFMDLLDEAAVAYQIVLTKVDTIKAAELPPLLQNLKETLSVHAAAHPDIGIIGSEVFLNGVAGLLKHIAANGAHNVRVFNDDAPETLYVEALAAPDTIDTMPSMIMAEPSPVPNPRNNILPPL